jgi:hypothetical protein
LLAAEYVILQREYEQNNGPHPAVAAANNYILHARRHHGITHGKKRSISEQEEEEQTAGKQRSSFAIQDDDIGADDEDATVETNDGIDVAVGAGISVHTSVSETTGNTIVKIQTAGGPKKSKGEKTVIVLE